MHAVEGRDPRRLDDEPVSGASVARRGRRLGSAAAARLRRSPPVSEYQYYEFLAIDRPLDAREQQELRAVSTRARITPTHFVNTYEWGDLRGDPRALMASYFDAFLYLANWGTRQLMFRWPSSLLDLEVVGRYCTTDTACAWSAGDSVIVSLTSEKEDDYWEESTEESLSSIVPVRSELALGDRRLLYLAWLLSVDAGVLQEDELEPAIPPGLAELTGPLRAVVEFLRLDDDLLSAAAAASEPLNPLVPTTAALKRWVARLPDRDKQDVLVRLASGDQDVSREFVRRFRTDRNPTLDREGTRTVVELQEAALQAREGRERLAAQRLAEEKAGRERARAAAREQHLTWLATRQEQAWTQVYGAIDTRQPAQYGEAVKVLQDLRAVSEREERLAAFDEKLADLRQRHAKKPSLLERLERAGLSGTPSRAHA
jgi:hypothetical protein